MNVQLGKYKGLGLSRPNIIVKDEEINDYINKIREQYKVEVEKEGYIENGDYIAIDYDGYYEGEHIPQISRNNYHSRIGQGFFLDKFENNLLGKRSGDKVKFDLVLPDDYELKYLRSETVQFGVKILSVKNQMIPELNDDVVGRFKIEGINTIGELREYVKEKIYYQKIMVESANIINEIMNHVIENSKVELKNEEIESLECEILEDFKKELKKRNVNLEIYLSYTKKTEEEVLKQCELEAKTYLTEKAIIEKIAQIENITLNDEEIDSHNQLLYQKVIHFLLRENTK
ncbi:hypothetical protein [Romboutsia sp.]|uniref:hypothetical protein n=1 Tax=Romboutsia sp. TaxID=1965302 RepID=UPI002CF7DAC1|nr:hypothetical protein [Romboutsia sp.]HSQ87727.1 hypothetical protein [Romboutsia sp.]